MSKPVAGFHGQKSFGRSPLPKPQEYRVLGVNQPLIAPESEQAVRADQQPRARGRNKLKIMVSLLVNKLL